MLTHLLAADPLLNNVDGITILFVVIKAAVTFVVLLVTVLLVIWYERKFLSFMQSRVGPQEAGPFGILQSLADGVKIFFKEALVPRRADRVVFRIAPYLAVVPAFLTFAIVPVGGTITIGHRTTLLQLADPPVGILWMLAMSGIAVYGIMLAGWSSGSKYPLLGSVRASAQMISYEAALGLSIASVVLVSGSLSTRDIVLSQATRGIGGVIPNWNVVQLAFVPFIIFMLAATAEMNRPPFDLTEADSELVGGYMTEYSSIGFAFFYLAEFMNLLTMSAIMVTLFFGGPTGPWMPDQPILNWLMPIVYFLVKVLIFVSIYVWIRATLPRLRYDQLMDLGWKVLIPVSLYWLLVIAAIKANRTYTIYAVVGGFIAGAGLYRAMAVGKARAAEQRLEASAHRRAVGGITLMGVLDGFKITFRNLFEGNVTTRYPHEKRPKPERFHGRHVLNKYEDGMEKCIGCELCAGVCPARCIYVRGRDNPVDAPVSPGERYGFVYEINYLRCIHCDLCVEACPTEAITESKMFEFSFTNRRDAIYTKDELVVGDDGRPRELPWEDWRPGDDEHTSAWMRATSPGGSARFEGRPLWSGELGYGLREPEDGQQAEDDEFVAPHPPPHGQRGEADVERDMEHRH